MGDLLHSECANSDIKIRHDTSGITTGDSGVSISDATAAATLSNGLSKDTKDCTPHPKIQATAREFTLRPPIEKTLFAEGTLNLIAF